MLFDAIQRYLLRLQRPSILNRLRHMDLPDARLAIQIRNRARHLQHAVIGPRRPVHPHHCRTQQPFTAIVGTAMHIDLRRLQVIVGLALARLLRVERALNACGDRR